MCAAQQKSRSKTVHINLLSYIILNIKLVQHSIPIQKMSPNGQIHSSTLHRTKKIFLWICHINPNWLKWSRAIWFLYPSSVIVFIFFLCTQAFNIYSFWKISFLNIHYKIWVFNSKFVSFEVISHKCHVIGICGEQ